MSGDRLARIEAQEPTLSMTGVRVVLLTPEERDALVEIAKAARDTVGYQDDLNPVWQLGAAQDWGQWKRAKDKLRAALARLDSEVTDG